MITAITIIIEEGNVTAVYGPSDQDIVVSVIDTDSTDPEYVKECREIIRDLESDPDHENYYE